MKQSMRDADDAADSANKPIDDKRTYSNWRTRFGKENNAMLLSQKDLFDDLARRAWLESLKKLLNEFKEHIRLDL